MWLMCVVLSVRILTDVVPRLEPVESWTEDELVTILNEAAHDLGVVQKTFMTVLRHALSGMKVCGTVPRSTQDTYCLGRLDPGWRRSWMLLAKSGAWLACGVERLYLEYDMIRGFIRTTVPYANVVVGPNTNQS